MSNDTDSDDESEYAYDNGGGGGRNLDEDAAMEAAILESAAVAAASAVAAAAAAAANLAPKACSSSSLKSAPLPSTPNGTEVRRVRAKVEGGNVEIIQRLEPTPTKNGEAWYDEPCSKCHVGRRCSRCKTRINKAIQNSRAKRKLEALQQSDPAQVEAKTTMVNTARRSDYRENYRSLAKVAMRQARDLMKSADKHGRDLLERMSDSPGGSLGSRFDVKSAAYSEFWRDNKKAAAKKHLIAACAENCAEAHYKLAIMMLIDSTADRPEAFRLINKAAEMGYADAHMELARSLDGGRDGWHCSKFHIGTEISADDDLGADEDLAVQHYRGAALGCNCWGREQCDHDFSGAQAEALRNLSYVYKEGLLGREVDGEEAKKLLLKAAVLGSIEAQYCLAHSFSVGLEIDLEEARKWYRIAAKNEDGDAQWVLGRASEKGMLGIEVDLEEAMKWYQMAAQNGQGRAQRKLALCYEYGDMGLEINFEEAASWYDEAAKSGDTSAQYFLAQRHEYGYIGLKVNIKEAYKWYLQSAEGGDHDAQYTLGDAYQFGHLGLEIDFVKARDWYIKAADQGHCDAKCQLAQVYQLGGIGVEKSETAAFEVHGMVISEHAEDGYQEGYFCDRCKGKSSLGHLGGSMRRWFCVHCSQDLCFECFPEP